MSVEHYCKVPDKHRLYHSLQVDCPCWEEMFWMAKVNWLNDIFIGLEKDES